MTKNKNVEIIVGVFLTLVGLVLFGINKFGNSINIENLEEINVTISIVPKCIETRSNNNLQHIIYINTKEYKNSAFLIDDKTYYVSNAKKAVKLKPDDKAFVTIHHDDFSKIKSDTTNKKIIRLYGIRSSEEIFYTAEDKVEFDKASSKNTMIFSLIGGIGLMIYGLYKKKYL